MSGSYPYNPPPPFIVAVRMGAIGASRPLRRVPTKVRLLNRLPTLDLRGRDYSSCPIPDLGPAQLGGRRGVGDSVPDFTRLPVPEPQERSLPDSQGCRWKRSRWQVVGQSAILERTSEACSPPEQGVGSMDIAAWLQSQGLERYVTAFQAHNASSMWRGMGAGRCSGPRVWPHS